MTEAAPVSVDGKWQWKVTVRNDSSRRVFGVRIHTFRAVAGPDAAAAPMRSIHVIDAGPLSGMVADRDPYRAVLKPKASFETLWAAVDSYDKPVAPGVETIHLSLTDANGRIWSIKDYSEPTKVPREVK